MPSNETRKQQQQFTIGERARGELSTTVRWVAAHNHGGGNLPTEPFTKFGPLVIRWAKCSANSLCPTYPPAPANTVPIIFGDLDFEESCGFQSREFLPYEPAEDRYAHDAGDVYHQEGEIRPVFMSRGKWYFFSNELCNIWYTAVITEALCPTNRGSVAITDVEPVERPEPPAVTARITEAVNYFGRAARVGAKVKIMRVANSGSGGGSGSCDDVFYITQVEAVCRDIPVTGDECSGSGADEGKFIFREECGSGSGAEVGSGTVGSGVGCSPIQGWVLPNVAVETCAEEPELIDQLELEMFDGVANMDMNGCPTWVNFAFCAFAGCLGETEETADCEPCPEDSGSGG